MDFSIPILRSLDFKLGHRVIGRSQGDYLGMSKGHGMEFGDAREYEPGDDTRLIDWATTARTNVTHVRDVIAEHELSIGMIVDMRPQLALGTRMKTKVQLGLIMAQAFSFVLARGANPMRLYGLLPGHEQQYPPVVGSQAMLANIAALEKRAKQRPWLPGPPPPTTGLGPVFKRVANIPSARMVYVVMSDFFRPVNEWERELRQLAVRHEVVCVQLSDPIDVALPKVGMLTFSDPETNRQHAVDTSSAALRQQYAIKTAERQERIHSAIERAGGDHLQVWTNGDVTKAIVAFIEQRNARTRFVRQRR